jgi:chemotaxis signal transduction protein
MSDVHVRLRVGREWYALPVAHVVSVVETGAIARVPGSGPALAGVRNLEGQVLPVFDLGTVLGIASDEAPTRVVVATHDGRTAGLAVDEVTDVEPLASEPGRPETDTADGCLSGAILEQERLVGVVDVGRLLSTLERAAA